MLTHLVLGITVRRIAARATLVVAIRVGGKKEDIVAAKALM